MKLSVLFAAAWLFLTLPSCKDTSPDTVKPLCDTTCMSDTLKFNLDHPRKPFVYITANDCLPDSLIWSHDLLDDNRKMGFRTLMERNIRMNKSAVECFIKDTSYAWLKFNDCVTGRGFVLKLPFNKKNSISNYSSALNSFDPQFKIQDGLICYADYAFLYVEDMNTGKVEKLLLNDKELKIDFNNIHETFESVNVTRNKITANIIVDGVKKTVEKTISQ